MKYLLDTHIFLWFSTGNIRLSERAKNIIEDIDNEIYLSSAVVWEIGIKSKIGKVQLKENLDTFIADSIQEYCFIPLPITIPQVIQIYKLPEIPKDPFDRMLIAQSQVENLHIITSDEMIKRYDVKTIW